MRSSSLSLGRFKIVALSDGQFFLDGGAMFGVVPKTIWQGLYPADTDNRIRLALNCFVIDTGSLRILVETGIGKKLSPKLARLYDVLHDPGLLPSLELAGYKPEDVDIVINTHLHFDHCGGNTHLGGEGEAIPSFPRARYILQKKEWEAACHPNDRDKGSYAPENFLPLEEKGQVQLIEGDTEICRGIWAVATPGHTPGHQSVRVESEGRTLFLLGDLVPTSAHVRLSYVMSYDLYPLETMETKKAVWKRGIAEGWVFGFVHDPVHFFGRVVEKDNRFVFQPV